MDKQRTELERRIEELYQQEKLEIERVYQEGLGRIEGNRTKRLEDLDLFLPVLDKQNDHNQDADAAANDEKDFVLKKAVEDIVNVFDFKTDISQPIVYKKLEQKYPKTAPNIEKTNVSKVLKQLVEKEKLKIIKEAHGTSPAIYRRLRKEEK